MIRTPRYSYKALQLGDYWYPGFDRENMQTAENQLDALISFVGPGVISGWDITKFSIPSEDEATDASYRVEQLALIDAYDTNPTSRLGKVFSGLGLVHTLVACRVATTSEITLSGLQKIDGIDVVAGDRILVKSQTTNRTQNGIYLAASGAWSRASDLDNNSEFEPNTVIRVSEGSDYEKSIWLLSPASTGTSGTYTVGSTKIFFHNAWEQVIRVTAGTGFIGKHAAKTEVVYYFRLLPVAGNEVYLVWAEASHCLVTEGIGIITCPSEPDDEYDLTHTATFLGEVYVAQRSDSSTGDFRIYIDRIDYTDRRQNLKNLASALDRALRDSFYKHVHLGGESHPSQIRLDTRLVLKAEGPVGSTIFLVKDSNGNIFKWQSADYGIPEVRLNNTALSESMFLLDAENGKLYLKNSIPLGATLQVILPLAPATVLTIHPDSHINSPTIFLSDGIDSGIDSEGEPLGPRIFTWNADDYHEPVVYLRDANDVWQIVDIAVSLYTVIPNRGAIEFATTLNPVVYADDDLRVVLIKLKDEIVEKLSGVRIADVDASTFTLGQLDLRRLRGLDHVGQVRYLDPASIKPIKRLFSEGDHKTFYPEIANTSLQYGTELHYIHPSTNLEGVSYALGSKRGLMTTSDLITADLMSTWVPDRGQPVQLMDNLLPPTTNHFGELYMRTWDDGAVPKTGRIYFSNTKGLSWNKLKLPTISTATNVETALATSFSVTTERQEVSLNFAKSYVWYRVLHLGTNKGLWSATVLEGLTEDEWEWTPQSYISQSTIVHVVLEVVTLHQSWDSNGSLTETFDRTLYVGADSGFYVNGFLVSSRIIKSILWLQLGSDPRLNNIVFATDNEVFVTHTAELISTPTAKYYNHPLAFFQSGTLDKLADVKVASTTNVANFATAPLAVDGVTLAVNDRILVRSQTNSIQNGIYKVDSIGGSTAVWSRAADFAVGASVDNTFYVEVTHGNQYAESVWRVNVVGTKVVNTDSIPWTDLYFRVLRDESRNVLSLHQHTEDPSNYFALCDKGIYRIIDSYDSSASSWEIVTASQISWEEEHQGEARHMLSTSGGDFGILYVASNKGVWKSGNGIWDSESSDAPWTRTSNQFLAAHEPTVYDSLTGAEYLSEPFGTTGVDITHSVPYQAFIWTTARDCWDNFYWERDYQEFYVAPWNASGADVVVYIGNSASSISYALDADNGKITFTSGLERSLRDSVKITIIRLGAFISNVGDTPHEELPNSFVTDSEHITVLSQDFTALDTVLHVADDTAIPLDTNYIELQTALSKERLAVTVSPSTREISLAKPRSGVVTFPKTVTKVFLVGVQSILGIEDEITKRQSNQTYHLNSLGGVNTIQLTIKGNTEFSSPNLFDNYGVYPKLGTEVERGPKNALFFDFSVDEFDVKNSSNNLWVGYEATGDDDPVEPHTIYFIESPAVNGEGMRLGTDQGIWRYSSSKWVKDSDLGDANKVYFIQSGTPAPGFASTLIAGTDLGAFDKASGSNAWSKNATFSQACFSQLDDQAWETGFTYDAWGKEDGLAFVLYDTTKKTFTSDHFDALDGRRVYGLHHDQFIRISTDASGTTTQTPVNTLYLCTEDGLYAVTGGNRGGSFSSILTGREMFGANPKKVTVTLPAGGTQSAFVKFYRIAKSARPNTNEFILLSNNGVYIVPNWRFCDPDPTILPQADFYSSAHNLSGVSCNCSLSLSEGTNPVIYKLFIGTNKGVYRSYDDGYTFERCERIAGGDTTVYDIKLIGSNTILIATDKGLFYSDDDGDTWAQPGVGIASANFKPVVSTAKDFDGGYLAQTFVPSSGTTTTLKVALSLSLKDIEERPEYTQSLNNTLEIAVYNTSSGVPSSAISPAGTPDTITASDVLCSGFEYAEISVAGLSSLNTYAVVVREIIASGGISIFRWNTSKLSNPYSGGQAFVGGPTPTWVAQTNEDFYFKVYFDNEVVVTESNYPVGRYDSNNIGFFEGTGRGYAVTDDGYLTTSGLTASVIVVDDSKSIKWSDPSSTNPRETEIPDLLRALLDPVKVTLSGSIYAELGTQEYWPSVADFWIFGTRIIERTDGYTNDLDGTLTVVASALHERGAVSEPFDAASQAFSGLSKQAVIDSIIKEDDEEGNLERSQEVIQYLEDRGLLRYDDVLAYWTALPASTRSAWGTTGGATTVNIALYDDVRDYVIERFSNMFVPAAFLIADGDGDGNPTDTALTIASAWDDDGVRPFVYGVGHSHKQDGLRTLVDVSEGKHFDISNGANAQDWDFAKNSIAHGGNNSVFKASWHREFDYNDPVFVRKAYAEWTLPSSDLIDPTVVIQVRFTLDRINFTPWQTLTSAVDYEINQEVLGIQYKVYMTQGITSADALVNPTVEQLYHVEVTPATTYLVTNSQDTTGMVFEHLLSAAVNLPPTARTSWGIVRGDSHNPNDFEEIHNGRKGALANRQRSIQFTDEVIQSKLNTTTADFHHYYVRDANGQLVTWASTDIVQVYAFVLGQYQEVVPDGYDGDNGFVFFSAEQPQTLVIKVTLTSLASLIHVDGEPTTTKDGTTYSLSNGAWPCDAIAIVLVNGKIKRGGYWLSPEEGTVTFSKERERTDIVTVFIQFAKKFRVAVHIRNFDTSTPVTIDNFGLFYTIKDNRRLVFDYFNSNSPTINGLAKILPASCTAYQRMLLNYEFVSEDGNEENGTKTTWWRKRPADTATYTLSADSDGYFQITAENIETIGASSNALPEYNNRTLEKKSDVGALALFKVSDQVKVKVQVSDGISIDSEKSTSAIILGSNRIPFVTSVTISAAGFVESPTSSGLYYVLAGEELRASYVFDNGEGATTTINGTAHTSTIQWFKNEAQTVYSTLPKIAAGVTIKGEVYSFKVTPSDGTNTGIPVRSVTVTVR